ncbi:hypothetical protein GCM10011504_17860 [Siccirubricoccus deserti]|nr:hypothetical protein GCM10011504_17860 [Siccirubricoccus deserti]
MTSRAGLSDGEVGGRSHVGRVEAATMGPPRAAGGASFKRLPAPQHRDSVAPGGVSRGRAASVSPGHADRAPAMRRRLGLRAHLLGLVLAVLLPSLALGGVTAWHMAQICRLAFEDRLADTARALASAVDSEISRHLAGLSVLAASPALDVLAEDEAAEPVMFRTQAERAGALLGSPVVVLGRDLRQRLPALSSKDPELPVMRGAGGVARLFATGQPVVSDVMVGAAPGQAVAGVAVPILRAGRVVGILGTRLELAILSRALVAPELSGGLFATLVDGSGLVAAGSAGHEQYLGGAVPAWYLSAIEGRDRGIAQGTAIDEQAVILAFQRLVAAPGWTLAVGETFAAYRAAWLNPQLGLAAGGAFALTFGIALSAALSRRILRPVFALVRHAEGAGGERPAVTGLPLSAGVPAGVAEFEVLRDATERAEAALRGANRRNAEVLASIGETLYALDPDGHIIFASDHALAFWRLRLEEVLGCRFDELLPQAVGSAAWEAKRYAAARHEDVHLCTISAVTHRWIEIDIYPRGDGGITVAFRDIEQRRRDHLDRARAEAALRESEERFRLVAESAPVMLWMVDAEGKCLYLNAALREFWGVGPEGFDTFDWSASIHPEDRDRVFQQVGPAMQARKGFTEEARYRRGDGEYRVLRTVAQPRFGPGGEFLGMIGVNADITDAARAEAALRASEERLRLAQEAGGIGAWERDLASGMRHWSESNYRLWGVEPGTPVTRELLTSLIHPEDLARSRLAMAETATVVGALPELEMRIIRRSDGAVRWMLSCAEAVADANGRPVRHIGIMRDITAQKEALDRLALLMRELDHRAKNALAVVSAAVRLTHAEDIRSFVRAVEGRVAALARAHTMLAQGQWTGAELQAVVTAELAAFLPAADGAEAETVADQPRVDVMGPALTVSPAAAQALSMTLHELATNATKYGALSTPGGHVSVAWQVEGAGGWLRLRWTEDGGPPVVGVPERRGFGSRVIEATVKGQLGGRVDRRWDEAGLVCTIEVPLARALAGGVETGG